MADRPTCLQVPTILSFILWSLSEGYKAICSVTDMWVGWNSLFGHSALYASSQTWLVLPTSLQTCPLQTQEGKRGREDERRKGHSVPEGRVRGWQEEEEEGEAGRASGW